MVPGALGTRSDSRELRWNIESNGAIGRSESGFLNSASALLVDGEPFQAQRLRMSPDASALYLPGKRLVGYPDLSIFRHISVGTAKPGVYYEEMFRNDGEMTILFDVELKSQFSASMDMLKTDTGREQPKLLRRGERGLIIEPKSSGGDHALLYSLTSASSDFRPTISSPSVYSLSVIAQIELKPGEVKSFRHAVSKFSMQAEATELSREFAVVQNYLFQDPNSVGSEVINRSSQNGHDIAIENIYGGALNFLSEDVPGLGDSALLRLPDQSPIRGAIDTAPLSLKHYLGIIELAVDDVIAFGRNQKESWAFLGDGQLVIGDLALAEKVFSPQNGVKPLDLGTLNAFSVQLRPLNELNREEMVFELTDGSIFRVEAVSGDGSVTVKGSYGMLNIPGDQVTAFNRIGDAVTLSTINDMSITSDSLEGSLRSSIPILGKEVDLPVSELSFLRNPRQPSLLSDGDRVETSAGDVLLGKAAGSESHTITLAMSAGEIAVKLDQIAEIEMLGKAGDHQLILEDGTVLRGTLKQYSWKLETEYGTATLATADLERLTKSPRPLSAEEKEQFEVYVNALGDDNWQKREAATEGLITMGRPARHALSAALPEVTDPEVRHRMERVIALDSLAGQN